MCVCGAWLTKPLFLKNLRRPMNGTEPSHSVAVLGVWKVSLGFFPSIG